MHLAQDFSELFTLASLISLITLSLLEIVLGIDNIIFISIVANKLPREQQAKARSVGLMLALVMRIILLFSISWIVGLKEPLFEAFGFEATGRDLILFAGGLFLLVKTTTEIHNKIEGNEESGPKIKKVALNAIITQIVFIDIVFSFDSILTAVGLVSNLLVMILAVIIAMVIMLIFSEKVSDFINNNPTIKMLALAFLLMIGMLLVLDAAHIHVPKEFVYFSMAFSLLVEFLNIRLKRKEERRRNSSNESN
ncbi:MAG: TerC family protein [Bacteroidetes bacterium]|nr:TerC family protein [Bacteroidota bacterium]